MVVYIICNSIIDTDCLSVDITDKEKQNNKTNSFGRKMKIAYIIGYSISPFNGIRIQAEVWAEELIRKGHSVIKVNPWKTQSWEEFDVVHIFGPCQFIYDLTSSLYAQNPRIVFSPIIDTIESIWKYRLVTLLGIKKLRMSTPNYTIRCSKPYIRKWFARSKYEVEYVNKAYGVPLQNISVVPLSYRIIECENYPSKKPFCLHVSKITDGRKNVMRLMQAAIKYKFQLVLAGSIASEESFSPLKKIIDAHENITYLGRVSDDELIKLYKEAKVFALPSINEGVGMVAVEAASYGCDIVITSIGGPKEYYADMAYVVNPFDIDDIGNAVSNAMQSKDNQPKLMEHIKSEYNLSKCVDDLVIEYKKVNKS